MVHFSSSFFFLFFKVNRIPSRKKTEKPSILLHNIASNTASITKFIEFGKGSSQV